MWENFLDEKKEKWWQYKRMLGSTLFCIILTSISSSTFNITVLTSFTMTQSQLLSHGEEMKSRESSRKRLKISVAYFDNSALIKT